MLILPIVGLLAAAATLVATEMLLRWLLPYDAGSMGYRYCDNALKYGWGYAPGDPIVTRELDQGRRYYSRANNHGWRDRDRRYSNPSGSFRVLVLGDSNTFGVSIPAEEVYTRVLERRLRAEGYDVEIINMAYASWGTDQELEALKSEGLRYGPDLVIVQFTINDLWDTLYWRTPTPDYLRPFTYTLGPGDSLVKSPNPTWDRNGSAWEAVSKRLVIRSEVLKRLYRVFVRAEEEKRWRPVGYDSYPIELERVERIECVLQPIAPLLSEYLHSQVGQKVSKRELLRVVEAAGEHDRSESILRLLELRSFGGWPRCHDMPAWPAGTSLEWRLYFALMREIVSVARSAGADVAIFSDHEMGRYRWERFWYRVPDGERARAAYLGPSARIRRFARANGILYVESPHEHVRSRNDMHPNVEGNVAMAENIREFLLAHYASELAARHRRPARQTT